MKKIKQIAVLLVAAILLTTNAAYASFPVKDVKTNAKTEQTELNAQESKVLKSESQKETPSKVDNGAEKASPKKTKGDGGGKGFAIAGFVASILGLFILPIIFIPAAIIFSALGLKSDLKGLAIAGLVIGIIGLLLWIILIAFILSTAAAVV